MRFEVGDIVRLAWHDSVTWPGVVVLVDDDEVRVWWPDLQPTPFIVRLSHNDGDFILYDKGTTYDIST